MSSSFPHVRIRVSLRVRLMGAFTLLAVPPILLLGGMAILNARRDVQREVVRGNLALIRAIGHQLNTTLQDARRGMVVAAAAWAQARGAEQPILRSLRTEFSLLRRMAFLDAHGRHMGGDPIASEIPLELANTYGGYVSEVISSGSKREVLMVVQARDSKGELFGFLAGSVDLSFVQERLSEARLGKGAALLVIDGNGQEVASNGRLPDRPADNSLRAANPAVDAVLATHSEGVQEMSDASGVRWLAVYRNIVGMSEFRGVRWGLLLLQPVDDAYALARKATRDTILVALAALALALLCGGYLANRITDPLAQLVRRIDMISEENFEPRLDLPDRADEIGVLTDRFAAMLIRLRHSRDTLYAQTELGENLVRSIPVGVISINREGIIRSINPAQERLSRVDAERTIGRAIVEAFPAGENHALIHDQLQEVLAKGQPVDETFDDVATPFITTPILRCRIRIAPLRNRAGQVDGAVIVQEDLSERARLEAQLVRSEKLSSVGVLAAGVAHEINNPLTTILGYAKLLLEQRTAEDPERPALELVAEEAHRVQEIVRNLLDFSRQEVGEMLPLQLNGVLERVLSLVAPDLRKRGIDVVRELAVELPLVLADGRRVEQVFVNLITNAAQAMIRGGTLTVRTGSASSRAVPIFVEFVDTGTGIAPELLPRIFDPFFTTKEPGQGTGLGLAVSHGIVSDHGGSVEVQSRVGQGSTFRVWLREAKGS